MAYRTRILEYAELDHEEMVENEEGAYNYTRWFQFKVSSVLLGDHLQAIRHHDPDLARYAPHPEHAEARLVYWRPTQRRDAPQWFDVEAGYTTVPPELLENPLDLPATIEVETIDYELPVFREADGTAYTNAAGEFLEGRTENVGLWVFNVTRNVASIPTWLEDYKNATNSDVVPLAGKPRAERTLHLARMRIGGQQSQTVAAVPVTYRPLEMQLVLNPDTHDNYELNRGLYETAIVPIPVTDSRQRFRYMRSVRPITVGGERISDPVFLDEQGFRPRINQRTGKRNEFPRLPENGLLTARQAEPFLAIQNLPPKAVLDRDEIVILRKRVKPEKPFRRLPLS